MGFGVVALAAVLKQQPSSYFRNDAGLGRAVTLSRKSVALCGRAKGAVESKRTRKSRCIIAGIRQTPKHFLRGAMQARVLLLTFTIIWIPASIQAQGFGIYEQGTCAMSLGGATVAEPCDDGSAIYVNPAALAGQEGLLMSLGGTAIFGTGTFTADPGGTTRLERSANIAPHNYLQYGITDRFAVGAGLYVPYGLGTKWPLDFAGRFVSYDSRLTTFYVQPTAAFKVNDRLSLGAGLTVAVGSVELNRREDLSRVPLGIGNLTFAALVDTGTDFANTSFSARRAWGAGGHFGILVAINERVSIGARYITHVKLSYKGSVDFSPVGTGFRVTKVNPLHLPVGTPLDPFVSQALAALPDQDVATELDMPAQFTAGVRYRLTPRLKLLGEYHWVGWSTFDTVTIDFSKPQPADETLVQNYRNTNAIHLGGEFAASSKVRLRAGYFQNQAAAPDESVTPLLPESRRVHLTGGIGWNLRPNVIMDMAYHFIAHADRRGRVENPPPGELPTPALNSGVYRARGDLLGITLTYRR